MLHQPPLQSLSQAWVWHCHLTECSNNTLPLGELSRTILSKDKISWPPFVMQGSSVQDILASVIHLCFLFLLLLAITWKRVNLCKSLSKPEMAPIFLNGRHTVSPGTSKAGALYWATFASCIILCLANLCIIIWGVIFGIKKGWSRIAFLEPAAIVQVVAWFTMSVATKNALRKSNEKLPGLLRAWWIFAFLVATFAFCSEVVLLTRNSKLLPDAWVDIFTFPISIFLCFVALFGRTGVRMCVGEDVREPLLNRVPKEEAMLEKVTPYATAGFFSLAFFSWCSSFLAFGYKNPIQLDDIPQVADRDRAEVAYGVLKSNWDMMKAENPTGTVSMFKVLLRSFGKSAAVSALYAGSNTCASFVGPYLIDDFVNFLGGKRRFAHEGYILVGVFFGAKIVESLSQRHWLFGIQQWGMRIRAALTAMIYRKGLSLSNQSRQSHTSGEIINYMSVDVQRIGDFSWYLHDTWLLPLQIGLALIILYTNLGLASLAALGATACTMLGNLPLGKVQEKFQGKIMAAKDERMKATSEVLRSMKILKLQAWELKYLKKLEDLRKVEYGWLHKFLYTQSAVVALFWGAPTLVAVVTFSTCVLMGIPLTAGRVLSSLATFRILQEPIYNLPDLVSMIAQTKVSLERIGSFLQEEELPSDAVICSSGNIGDLAIEIEGGSFSWDISSETPTLVGLELQIRKGMRVAVCGMVGSGKSSLLSSILGEVPKLSGTAKVSGSKAYVAQSAWIQSGKIEENILFGNPMNRAKYESVLQVCALKKDLELFSHGDQTEIGERGINLSGGQKQRIQLARAIYQDADIYLLDDPFSAVDAHTGTQLFKECILGSLATKTVVYVTHQVEFLPAADLILVLRDGKIAQAGKYDELLQTGTDFSTLVGAHNKALETIDAVETSIDSTDDVESTSTTKEKIKLKKQGSNTRQNGDDCQKLKRANSKLAEPTEERKLEQIVQEEERETGRVSMSVYWSFLTAAYKGALVPVILLAQTLFQVLQIASNYWMAWGTPATSDEEAVVSSNKLLLVYILLALGSALCILIRAVLVSMVSLITAQKLFMGMLRCIFHAPMSFFDATPAGRILNRASTDQSAVDLEVPLRLAGLAFSIIQLLGIVAVMSQVAWQVFSIFIPVAAICIWLQRYYITSARELARLVGIQKSPIIHHFGESISGVATIRGFDQEVRFMETNLQLTNCYSRPLFYGIVAMEWLCFRLDLLTNFVFAFSLVFVVSLPEGAIKPSVAGLAVTYGLNLNMLQAWVMWNLCFVENKIISVERIEQYTRIPSEAPLIVENSQPSTDWPSKGNIELKDLKVRYGEHMPFVLHGITCTFYGGKKVGVVGRTGSGKSTLIQTLFRIVEPAAGQILIDGLDILKIGLHDLRSRLSIIPQDPTMFEGTVRGNLDPLGQYTDAEIWEALEKSQLGDVVRTKDEKLNALVTENGENWSVGQRQLVCLGRALLKHTRILVLDEATASVDTATDGAIQNTIRTQFADCTVITIAHRIPTVIDSDWVLVLSDGRVAEYNSPVRLLEDRSSLFSQLVSEYSVRSNSVSNLTASM